MKLFLKFICLALVIGLVGPFILRAPNGQPYLDYRDFIPSMSGIKSTTQRQWNKINSPTSEQDNGNNTNEANTWGKTRVYRWQEADGTWRYADTAPPDVETEILWLDPREINISSSPRQNADDAAAGDDANAQGSGFELPLPLTVAPDEIPQLIEDTKQIQELINQRNEVLESINGEARQ